MRSNDQHGWGHLPAGGGLGGQMRKFVFGAAQKETKGQVQKTPEA